MSETDPFEAEQARRNQALDQDERERLMALTLDELPKDQIEEQVLRITGGWMAEHGKTSSHATSLNPEQLHDLIKRCGLTVAPNMINWVQVATEQNNEAVLQREQTRWNKALGLREDEDNLQRAKALGRPEGEHQIPTRSDVPQWHLDDQARLAAMRERALQRQNRREQNEEAQEQEKREAEDRLYPRIGGWQAGKDKQELQSLRFEIEADRALFLGKGAPAKADEKLRTMHESLAALHMAYQKSGDPSMLIGIADMTTRYETELAKHQKRKEGRF